MGVLGGFGSFLQAWRLRFIVISGGLGSEASDYHPYEGILATSPLRVHLGAQRLGDMRFLRQSVVGCKAPVFPGRPRRESAMAGRFSLGI